MALQATYLYHFQKAIAYEKGDAMLTDFVNSTIIIVIISMAAYVYSVVLTDPNMILGEYYNFLRIKIGHIEWLFKMVVKCDRCVSGQMALWYCIITQFHIPNGLTILGYVPTTAGEFLYIITGCIFTPMILKKIHAWTNKN